MNDVASRKRALVALALLIPVPSIGTLAGMYWETTKGTALGQGIYGFSKVWILLLPILWMLKVEKRWTPLGRLRAESLGVGAALGALLGAAILAGYYLIGRPWIDVEQVRLSARNAGLSGPAVYIGFAVYLGTINAALEEFVWRGFVSRQLGALLPGREIPVALLSAAAFTVHHVVALRCQFGWNVTLLASFGVFLGGVVWSACYQKYRSIWPGFVSHFVADAAILWIGWQLIFGI